VSLLDLRVFGDPVLRGETKPITTITDELQRLIDDMFETMRAAKGIGLAAPQVGRTERVAVVEVEERKLVIINPEIINRGSGRLKAEEGCLSIPEVYGDVERPATVTVKALDREGKEFSIDAEALLARCLQHEIDHLHGRLFVDYLGAFKRRSAMARWEDVRERYPNYIRRLADEIEVTHRDSEEM
jgi:peptide deformylase